MYFYTLRRVTMNCLVSVAVLIVVVATPGYALPSGGTSAPAQHFSCYYDWCEVPWEYCDKEEKRCNPCSWDVCRRQGVPKNCTQACQKLLSPKTTTTTTTTREPEQQQQLQESPQHIEKRLTTLTALVIALLIVVVIGFFAIGAIIFRTQRKHCSNTRDRDLEQPEERKPLQATESGTISQSSNDSPPPSYTTYPGQTPLDKGEPPIVRTIAGDAGRPASNVQSTSCSLSGGPATTYLASSGQSHGQVQSPAHRPEALSMPAPNAGSFDINSPRMTGNSYPLSTPSTQGLSKLQHQKDLIEDMDILNNINQPLLPGDTIPDNDHTAPKSNTFGARPEAV